MPLIRYLCTNGDCQKNSSKLYRLGSDAEQEIACKECGGKAKRLLSSPASSSKIVVDNGLQARATEIDPNIMDINSERARKPVDRGD